MNRILHAPNGWLVLLAYAAAIAISYTITVRIGGKRLWKDRIWLFASAAVLGIGLCTAHYMVMAAYRMPHEDAHSGHPAYSFFLRVVLPFFCSFVVLLLVGISVVAIMRKRLNEMELKYTTLFEQSPDLVLMIDKKGKITRANYRSAEVLGYEPEELLGRSILDLVCSEELNALQEGFIRFKAQQGLGLELGLARKSGERIEAGIVSIPLVTDGKLQGVCAVVKNMTEDKRLKEQLRKLTERHELLLNTMVEGVFGIDADSRVVFWNKAAEELTGYLSAEVIGLDMRELIRRPGPDGEPDSCRGCAIVKAMNARERCVVIDESFRAKDGTAFPVEYSVNPIVAAGSETAWAVVTFRDISERKRQENALLKSEEQYRTLVENLPDALVVVKGGKRLYANDTALRLFGAERSADTVKTSLFGEIDPLCISMQQSGMLDADREGPPGITEHRLFGPDDKEQDLEVVSFAAWYEGSPARYLLIRDVTELKRARELIQRSEKLSVAGELAAGIAHEIRNPLTAIKGFIQLIRHQMPISYYETILSEIGRIELIAGELLMLSKPQAVEFQRVDAKELIDKVVILLEAQAAAHNVELVKQFGSGPLFVNGEANQLKQVFINILKNSLEAMPSGGAVTMEVREEADTDEVAVVVRDEGVGISEEKLRLLGQPFYTTKEKGTGLGLMISLAIIENHGGRTQVYSQLGKGTQFYVFLPASRQNRPAGQKARE
ncbi:PAS domain S-box protein [Paenibacillus hodogayensis]|uniref:histidine kinase n=1 Tax=Paenibacillus hodogayensis TaxID=279208 RepID=A0ABV5VWB7_9BACL